MSFRKRSGTGGNITTISIFRIGDVKDIVLGDHYICVSCILSDVVLSVVPTYLHKIPHKANAGLRVILTVIVE